MSSVGKEALAFVENLIATSYQVTLREEILFLGLLSVFLSFFLFFVFWPIETTTSKFLSLTHTNLAKCTNQVTLSNEQYLFWA